MLTLPFPTTASIALLGLGKEGFSSYHFLKKNGYHNITLLDARTEALFSADQQSIIHKENHILGKEYLSNITSYDIIIKTPGISPYEEELAHLGDKIWSQARIFGALYRGNIIAVTGTKGKSTTTSLIYTLLKDAGFSVGIVGNIGNPVLDALEEHYEYVVFEISSYMLEDAHIQPAISVIVNIYPEHLDYHHGLKNYQNAKLKAIGTKSLVIAHKSLEEVLLPYANMKIFFGDGGTFSVEGATFTRRGELIFDREGIPLIGKHNEDNMCAALAVGLTLGIPKESIEHSFRSFHGLPHRLQLVTTKNDIQFYDDAISTTPQSTIAALEALKDVDTLFLGGTDRGYDFGELAQYLEDSLVKNIVFFPPSGKRIREALEILIKDRQKSYNFLETSSMKEAVDFAFEKTAKGKICLLSCASPSYSLWKNFEAKGDEFQQYIQKR